MTDEQIIKSFELCFMPTGEACRKCVYHEYEKLCKVERNRNVLDLINRKNDDIAELTAKISVKDKLLAKAEEKFKEYDEYIAELRADKTKLENDLWLANSDKGLIEQQLTATTDICKKQKAKIEALQMDNQQLQSDIINANQNYDHIKELWEIEKQKVKDAKEKVITSCKKLQTAKAEIERLKGWQDLLKAEKHSLIKSEAIKKFENKILELFPSDKDFTTISRFTVKQIAKGMTEQKG